MSEPKPSNPGDDVAVPYELKDDPDDVMDAHDTAVEVLTTTRDLLHREEERINALVVEAQKEGASKLRMRPLRAAHQALVMAHHELMIASRQAEQKRAVFEAQWFEPDD